MTDLLSQHQEAKQTIDSTYANHSVRQQQRSSLTADLYWQQKRDSRKGNHLLQGLPTLPELHAPPSTWAIKATAGSHIHKTTGTNVDVTAASNADMQLASGQGPTESMSDDKDVTDRADLRAGGDVIAGAPQDPSSVGHHSRQGSTVRFTLADGADLRRSTDANEVRDLGANQCMPLYAGSGHRTKHCTFAWLATLLSCISCCNLLLGNNLIFLIPRNAAYERPTQVYQHRLCVPV